MFSRSKLVALPLTLALALAVGVGMGGPVASAGPAQATAPSLAYITPGAGNPSVTLTVNTTGFCPTGDTYFKVSVVSGEGLNGTPNIAPKALLSTASTSAIGYDVPLGETLATWLSYQTPETPPATLSGAYTFDFDCFTNGLTLTPDLTFAAIITFLGSGVADTNTYTNTGTTLAASPSASAPFGSPVTFTAAVSPSIAAGQVQFMDGKTDLGAPVKVAGGQASYETSALAIGSHSVTATFEPLPSDTTNTWGPSTSAVVPYAVGTPAPVFVPTVSGTVNVGLTVDCVETVHHATRTTWSWYANGHKVAGAAGPQYKIPPSLKGKSLTCGLSATNSGGNMTATSAAVKVHPGAVKAHVASVLRSAMTPPAPVFVPTVWGTVTVQSTVSCVQAVVYATHRTWSWYANGHKIGGATNPQYKIPSSLKGKKLACELSAKNAVGITAETSGTVKVNPAVVKHHAK